MTDDPPPETPLDLPASLTSTPVLERGVKAIPTSDESSETLNQAASILQLQLPITSAHVKHPNFGKNLSTA
ncbi:MAG TPA: hypothetical protein DEF45_08685 [Rhodopirellula sp.]|nr:hypothetical protein [Rhodopirellula sp.]